MSMVQMAFDTLAYANRLKEVGVESKIAETQAEINAKVLQDLTQEKLATKDDLTQAKNELSLEIGGLKKDIMLLEGRMGGLENRVGGLEDRVGGLEDRVGGLEDGVNKLRGDVDMLRCEFKGEMGQFKSDILLKLGSVMVACTVVLGVLTTLFSHVH